MKKEFYDLVYHGYEWENDSIKRQAEFRKLVKNNFHDLEIKDAFDGIKGYRTELYADVGFDRKLYFSFLLAFGFSSASLSLQLLKMRGNKSEDNYFPSESEFLEILRERWPEQLKEEYR